MRIINQKKLLDYNDITIIPETPSYIDSRAKVDLSIDFLNSKLKLPIIAAPMPDVCNTLMCNTLYDLGAIGIIHRFQSIEEQLHEFQDLNHDGICAIGVTGDYLDRFKILYEAGCYRFCLDTANGASIITENAISKIKNLEQTYSRPYKLQLIAGNVASSKTFNWLAQCGVQAVRCGIAGGSACGTKGQTGVYHPMVSMLMDIYECRNSEKINCQIIADGGIKSPADMCKALVWADLVMVGGLLASALESPAKSMRIDHRLYKVFRGAASFSVQKEEGNKERPEHVEGYEKLLEFSGPVCRTISKFESGLRSSLSYLNSINLEQYRTSATIGILK